MGIINAAADLDTVDLTLPTGNIITVKSELSYGEEERLNGVSLKTLRKTGTNEQEISVDWGSYNVERILTWVVAWDLTDAKGKSLYYDVANPGKTRASIKNLKSRMGKAIIKALDTYVATLEEETDEKNAISPGTPDEQ